jgi:hypothetical protein
LIPDSQIDHGGDLADEFKLEALVGRMQHDALDERAQDLECFGLSAEAHSASCRVATFCR